MNIPSFHDGYFDGLWIGSSRVVHIFLRTQAGEAFVLVLQGVDALKISEVRRGNIIFDVDSRGPQHLTCADMEELYDVGIDTTEAKALLKAKSEQGLQLLEISASYGAQGLILFQTCEIGPKALS